MRSRRPAHAAVRSYIFARAFVMAALVLMAIAVVVFIQWHATSYFASGLEKAHADETVRIGSTSYQVMGSTVKADTVSVTGSVRRRSLALAYSLTLVRRAPILSVPGADPDDLMRAAEALARTQSAVSTSTPDRQYASVIRTSLFPTSFLSDLAETEAARRNLLAAPTESGLGAYLALQEKTMRAYESDLQKYRTAFDSIAEKQSLNYALLSGTVTKASMASALRELAIGISKTRARINARGWCLHGFTFACNENDITLPSVSEASPSQEVPLTQNEKDVLSLRGEAAGRMIPDTNDPGDADILVRLQTSACLTKQAGPFLFLLGRKEIGDQRMRAPVEYVGDLFFYSTDAFKSGTNKLTDVPRFFADHGIDLIRVSPESYYQCFDLALDEGRAEAIADVSGFAKAHAYLAPEESSAISKEKHFYDESLASAYLAHALSTVRDGRASGDDADGIIELALEWNYNSGGSELIAERISVLIGQYIEMGKANIRYGISSFFLFTINNGFYILYQAHNPSFIAEAPSVYISRSQSDLPSSLVAYSDIQKLVPRTEILNALKFFFQFHTAPATIR